MRDWVVTDSKDRECLRAARDASGAWRPWHGAFGRAVRLTKKGLLAEAGISAMPPHRVYVLTDYGKEELEVVANMLRG